MKNLGLITKGDLEIKFGNDVYESVKFVQERIDEAHDFKKPKKPTLSSQHSSAEVVTYAKDLEQYEKVDLPAYEEKKKNYDNEVRAIKIQLEEYIKEESGLNDKVPVKYADNVYSYAYSEGHSEGYIRIYHKLCELVEIFNVK